MIATEFYNGQGFGNQLWVFATLYSIAQKNNLNYGVISTHRFKGKDFLNIDFGKNLKGPSSTKPRKRTSITFPNYYLEKKIVHEIYQCDIRSYDSYLLNCPDGTVFDGNLQSLEYVKNYRSELSSMFKVEGDYFDGCVINLRGGEYKNVPNLFLRKEYFYYCISEIRKKDPNVRFKVVTDDINLAKKFFPDFPIVSSGGVRIFLNRIYISPPSRKIGVDFREIQNSKYLILSNSSFSWWAAWTNTRVMEVYAPKYWAAHNYSDGFWSTADIQTPEWNWVDRNQYL